MACFLTLHSMGMLRRTCSHLRHLTNPIHQRATQTRNSQLRVHECEVKYSGRRPQTRCGVCGFPFRTLTYTDSLIQRCPFVYCNSLNYLRPAPPLPYHHLKHSHEKARVDFLYLKIVGEESGLVSSSSVIRTGGVYLFRSAPVLHGRTSAWRVHSVPLLPCRAARLSRTHKQMVKVQVCARPAKCKCGARADILCFHRKECLWTEWSDSSPPAFPCSPEEKSKLNRQADTSSDSDSDEEL